MTLVFMNNYRILSSFLPVLTDLLIDLQELCLHYKGFLPNGPTITSFFSKLPEAPPPIAINDAIYALKLTNALNDEEQLTELGQTLVYFPMEPALAKTLVYSCLFKCVDPIINIVAALCYRFGIELKYF